jgi:hypothetical protein
VLDVEPEHALSLPCGVAVDDRLSPAERVAIDAAAWATLADWRCACGDALQLDGLDLGHVAEVELVAQCFLPAERLRAALRTCEVSGPIEAVGFDAAALRALDSIVPGGCTVRGSAAPPPPPPMRGRRTRLTAFN